MEKVPFGPGGIRKGLGQARFAYTAPPTLPCWPGGARGLRREWCRNARRASQRRGRGGKGAGSPCDGWGDEPTFLRCLPVLEAIWDRVMHRGDIGRMSNLWGRQPDTIFQGDFKARLALKTAHKKLRLREESTEPYESQYPWPKKAEASTSRPWPGSGRKTTAR